MDERALYEGNLDRSLVDIILAQLGEVQMVWIVRLFLAHTHGPAHGHGALATTRNLASCSLKIVSNFVAHCFKTCVRQKYLLGTKSSVFDKFEIIIIIIWRVCDINNIRLKPP